MTTIFQNILEIFQYQQDRPVIFSSGVFLVLFTVFLAIYGLLYKKTNLRLIYVLLFSCYFYYLSSGLYLLVLLGTILTDYYLSLKIHQSQNPKTKKFYLFLAVFISLGVLFFFKYTNFFAENLAWISGNEFQPFDIILPIGVSFYTFQSLSYLIDIYRNEIEPRKNILDYAFYMTFFPHLVAGPIVRAKLFLPQIRAKVRICHTNTQKGLFFITKGLAKKALIADFISQYVDLVFASPESYTGMEITLAIYAYALQIYCDFSGYSDMAIGIAWLMGYDLGINFKNPYRSENITEFWRRWHISLSHWLRDYLYIGMGGSRVPNWRKNINLFLTMLIGGFWHGAAWKFVFWGAMHGVALILQKEMAKLKSPVMNIFSNKIFSTLLTFHFVILLWVFFRAESFATAWKMIELVFITWDWAYATVLFENRTAVVLLTIIPLIYQVWDYSMFEKLNNFYLKCPILIKYVALILLAQLVVQFHQEEVQPFIYFQF
ncbi:MAG: MBOAT family O-acyltransferase [Cytophagales bacterium]